MYISSACPILFLAFNHQIHCFSPKPAIHIVGRFCRQAGTTRVRSKTCSVCVSMLADSPPLPFWDLDSLLTFFFLSKANLRKETKTHSASSSTPTVSPGKLSSFAFFSLKSWLCPRSPSRSRRFEKPIKRSPCSKTWHAIAKCGIRLPLVLDEIDST